MESLRAYCGNVAAPCYVTDAHGLILFYNEEAVALWGRRPVLGEERWCGSWRIYAHTGEPLPHEFCPLAIAIKENRPIGNVEAVVERPDGSRVRFLPLATPIRDAAGRLTGAINILLHSDLLPGGSAPEPGQSRRVAAHAHLTERVRLLSNRERQVMAGIVAGQSTKLIARSLAISPRTVEVHRRSLMSKLQVKSVAELVRIALSAEHSDAH